VEAALAEMGVAGAGVPAGGRCPDHHAPLALFAPGCPCSGPGIVPAA